MKQVRFIRDMRPYQANHEAALPDGLADKLIASGEAVAVKPHDGGVVLAPDAPGLIGSDGAAPVVLPRGRYLTRRK